MQRPRPLLVRSSAAAFPPSPAVAVVAWPWQLAARGNDVIANEHAQLQTQPHLVSAIADGAQPFMLLDMAA